MTLLVGPRVDLTKGALARHASALGLPVLAAAVGWFVPFLAAADGYQTALAALFAPVVVVAAMVRPQWMAYAGLALVSSDKFMSVEIGQLTLKPGHLFFALALTGGLARLAIARSPSPSLPVGYRLLLGAAALLAVTDLLSLVPWGADPQFAFARAAVVVVGAFVPVGALLLTVRTRSQFKSGLVAFLGGQVVVALYGLYQLLAPYAGLPQGIAYGGLAAGFGRIAALSYEPAFYVAYLVTALPLVTYLVSHRRRDVLPAMPVVGALLFTILLLTNSRAGYIAGALAIVATFVLSGKGRGQWRRMVRFGAVLGTVAILGVGVASTVGADLISVVQQQISSAFNPQEGGSNQQRSSLYSAAWMIFEDHAATGVGSGRAFAFLPDYGWLLYEDAAHSTVNSIPLQAAVESGVMGLIALAGLYFAFIKLAFRRIGRRLSTHVVYARLLLLGAALVFLVNGLFVTWTWDQKVWAVVGLAAAGEAIGRSRQPGRVRYPAT